ncbi:hypothetical protein LP420_16005 [Massilia sp. B-10]|nr:hypothetical protein LP420_16005 [Massilia sp. B-10]
MLWRTLGYTQLRIDAATQEIAARRPLASGGARHPADLSMVVAPGTGGALGAVAGRRPALRAAVPPAVPRHRWRRRHRSGAGT